MSTPFVVMLPIALLAIVILLSFVGCDEDDALNSTQPINPWIKYSQDTVLQTPTLVAYWRLTEENPGAAFDFKGTHHGVYKIPEPYPPDADNELRWPCRRLCKAKEGIVPGDIDPMIDEKFRCVRVVGGYIDVPWSCSILIRQQPMALRSRRGFVPIGATFRPRAVS